MNKIKNYLIGLVCVLMGCLCTACSNDDLDTNQYKGGVSLNVFGPSPVMRGGELRFIGSGMDQVTAVVIPGCGEITDIKVISENEIRVTVPQDAEPGLVTLKSPKGDITTITQLTFEEPIVLEALSPDPVKPGKQLTLTGDYLNLIKSVIFTDGVAVDEDDFAQHTRKTIVLTVPAEAQTGQIILSDATSLDEEDGTIPNYIYSEDELGIVLPSASSAVDLTSAKPGDIIEIVGSDLDLVKKIVMPSGEELEFSYVNDGGKESIIFTLPVGATDGAIVMIPASGVKVAIANLGMALPEQVVADPANELREGDVITLKGVNMELVTDITFPGAEENVTPDEQSATEVKVTVPAGTVTGDILLNTASGTSISVAIETQKPEFIAFAEAEVSLGNDVVIQGKNLDLVATVKYTGGASVEVKPTSSTELTVAMPTSDVESGVLTLVMGNGESIETEALTVALPEFCYITELPGEDVELKGGTVVSLNVENSDKLTDVQVKGQSVQYIINGNTLYFEIPASATSKTPLTLVSENGSISYNLAFIPASEVEIVIFNTLTDLGSWDEPRVYIDASVFSEDLPDNAKLVVYFAQKEEWGQVQFNDGDWKTVDFAELEGAYLTTNNAGGKEVTMVELSLTSAICQHFRENKGMILQGQNWIISKLAIKYKVSLKETIWSGEWTCSSWNGNQDLAWGGYDWSTFEVGQKIYFTFDSVDPTSGWGCISPRQGTNWGSLSSVGQIDFVPSAETQTIEFIPNATDVEQLQTQGGLVITGDGYILKKVEIE
jgi:hypothetical protein